MKKINISPTARKILLGIGCLLLAIVFWFVIKYTQATSMQPFGFYGFC